MKLSVYQVKWKIENGGGYVPPDPVGAGDFYEDLFGSDLITTCTAKSARQISQKARPNASVISVKLLERIC